MSQIFYEDMTLAELVESSSLIVAAIPQNPPVRIETIPIPLTGPSPDGTENPEFQKIHALYQVTEILLDHTGHPPSPGDAISVLPANWRDQLQATLDYYREGISESPVYFQYNGLHQVDHQGAILFLNREGPDLTYAMDGAIESLNRKAEILSLISNLPPTIQIQPSPRRSWWQKVAAWFGKR